MTEQYFEIQSTMTDDYIIRCWWKPQDLRNSTYLSYEDWKCYQIKLNKAHLTFRGTLALCVIGIGSIGRCICKLNNHVIAATTVFQSLLNVFGIFCYRFAVLHIIMCVHGQIMVGLLLQLKGMTHPP